jgi:hypothetical protein
MHALNKVSCMYIQHIQPGPGLGMPGMSGGMHVGPGNPLYAGRMRVPPGGGGLGGAGGLPGVRFDPIGPRGMPVSVWIHSMLLDVASFALGRGIHLDEVSCWGRGAIAACCVAVTPIM